MTLLLLWANFMKLRRPLIVFIQRFTNPIALWSFEGAVTMLMLFRLQKISTLYPIKHRALSNLIFRGTPCICIYSSRNLITLGLSETSTVGYLEKRSIHARKCISWSFSFVIGPTKSSWISSLGPEQFTKGCHFDAGVTGLRFLPISGHGLHFAAVLNNSQSI